MRAVVTGRPHGARAASSAYFLYSFAIVSLLLVAAANSLSAGQSLTVALALLGAVTLASAVSSSRNAAARVATAILIGLPSSHRRPDVLEPASIRQQDPRAPGRPQPRAPGATRLPLLA